MNIVKFRVFQYIHSCQHSFCSFDIAFIACDGKILHNLVETIIYDKSSRFHALLSNIKKHVDR